DSLYALERYEEAVEAYDRAIAADPDNEEAWNNKGFTFFMLGIHDEALACYEKALAINPTYKQAWYNKGYTFHGINRLEEAVAAYQKAIELDRGDEVLWNNLGNALYNLGRYDESIPYFERGLEVNPEYEIAWNNIGNALNKMGRHAESLKYHDKGLERVDEAIDDYAAAASKSHSAEALVRLSALLLRLGRPADALVPADEARSRHPADPRGWLAAGRAFAATGRGAEAIESFEKAKASGAGEASLELARWHHSIGGDAEALDALKGEAQLSSEALLLRADIHAALGHTDEALADHDAAIRSPSEGRDLAYRRKGQRLLDL